MSKRPRLKSAYFTIEEVVQQPSVCDRCSRPYDWDRTVVTFYARKWWRACSACTAAMDSMNHLEDVVDGPVEE